MCRATDGSLLTGKQNVLGRFKEHFNALLNGLTYEANEDDFNFLNDDGRQVDVPTLEEVEQAVSLLKNNRTPSSDNIPEELLKHGGEKLAKVMHEIVFETWNKEAMPDEWLEGVIVPLHKKGDKLVRENFRRIALLNAAYKVYARVLYNRLQPHAETILGECRCGFRRSRIACRNPRRDRPDKKMSATSLKMIIHLLSGSRRPYSVLIQVPAATTTGVCVDGDTSSKCAASDTAH